ncbi:MAG: DUF4177 domain-containing protein [Clostridium sp.]|nr:DUF4177 domain-containing protein [Clostridium sp.]
MQYKTVTITRKVKQKKKTLKDPSVIGIEYEEIINRQLAEGWKLLGIHPITTKRSIGCLKFIMLGFMTGLYEHYQTDVFILFRDDDTEQYTGPNYSDQPKRNKGESLKRAGAAMKNSAQGAMNLLKSGEASEKFNGLKDMVKSKNSDNNYD